MAVPWIPARPVVPGGQKWMPGAAVAPTVTVTLKEYDGAGWVTRVAVPKVWTGSGWVVKRPKRWTGSGWVDLP